MSLVIESSGGRVARYSHNFERVFQVPRQAAALLAVLMLRGPQTAGELRINCERLHAFADISSVEAFLNELADRPSGALVAELPRQPGARENRWMHLLSGAAQLDAPAASATGAPLAELGPSEAAALKANIARLEKDLAELKTLVGRICAELGITP
jgi:uncharacterized protein YceH (UPF0502 family)